jgi:hypothetical protein
MRKMICGGAVLAALVGASMYVAAQHAARCPDSFVGRCARTIYHMWDPMFAPRRDAKPEGAVAAAPVPAAPMVAAQPAPEIVEPIVIEPTDQEPPLAFPQLSPEIAAAIERLRGDEESEAPPKAFDAPARPLYMPYADEGPELVPPPTREPMPMGGDIDINLPGPMGLMFLPTPGWQALVEKAMEAIQNGPTERGNQEPADEGTPKNETSSVPQAIHYHAHGESCPFNGTYPSTYNFKR